MKICPDCKGRKCAKCDYVGKIYNRDEKKPLAQMTEKELSDLMRRCGNALKNILGSKSDFTLLVFDDPKVAQYLSTCARDCMIEALKETVHRLEHRQDIPRK